MTGRQPSSSGDLVALRVQDTGRVENSAAATVRAPDPSPPPSSPANDLSNVIPFARARRTGAEPAPPPVTITAADRPAPPPPGPGALRQAAIVICSIAVHSVLLFAFWQQPKELASIGIEAITIEIVVGDNKPVGLSPTPGQNEVLPSPPSPEVLAEDKPVETEQQKIEEAQQVTPEEKRAEVVKEQAVDQPTDVAKEVAPEQVPDNRPQVAMVETPTAEVPTAQPRETPPEMQAVITPPREQPKELRPVEPKAKQPAPKQAVQKQAEQKKEQKQAARPTPSNPADAAGGRGKSSAPADPNYAGRVRAHLVRYQQYPPSAKSAGAQGRGTVQFVIGGSGAVASVSVVSGTGNAALDQELAAMVRRASPFPPPPGGQSKSFTIPVNWQLR
jgi:TonB family protein